MKPKIRLLTGACGLALVMACVPARAATPISACRAAIVNPGPYVLTANLLNPDNTAPCLAVKASPVTIDLAGFVITGKGAQVGILGTNYLKVVNGAIQFFGTAVSAVTSSGVTLEGLRVISSSGDGTSLGDNARVTGSEFIKAKGNGLSVGYNAVITNCLFANNGIFGMGSQNGATISGSTASSNGSHGFGTGLATLLGNTANNNGG